MGEIEEDALKGYHEKAEPNSLPDFERDLIIKTRIEIEKVLQK